MLVRHLIIVLDAFLFLCIDWHGALKAYFEWEIGSKGLINHV